jgi:hypothetical protein
MIELKKMLRFSVSVAIVFGFLPHPAQAAGSARMELEGGAIVTLTVPDGWSTRTEEGNSSGIPDLLILEIKDRPWARIGVCAYAVHANWISEDVQHWAMFTHESYKVAVGKGLMLSAAYGVGRDSVADVVAGDCPTQLFPQRYRLREDYRREEAVYGTSRFDVLGALGFQHRQRPSQSMANPKPTHSREALYLGVGLGLVSIPKRCRCLRKTNTGHSPRSTAENESIPVAKNATLRRAATGCWRNENV